MTDYTTQTQTDKKIPIGRYEYVDVRFPPVANTDLIVPLKVLKVESPGNWRFIDVTPSTAFDAGLGTETIGHVYRSKLPAAFPDTSTYMVLRCSAANYVTRLLVFEERN
jgi:hypothetical protein